MPLPLNAHIFITGVTGFVGGTILEKITGALGHRQCTISVLVRQASDIRKIQHAFPSVKCIHGDLEDAPGLRIAAFNADMVIHNALSSDHLPSIQAIAEGLRARQKTSYLVLTSGTGILTYESLVHATPGDFLDPKIWSDRGKDLEELVFEGPSSIPEGFSHRPVEKFVLSLGHETNGQIKVAIVSPPTIYGRGTGPCRTSSLQIPSLIHEFLSCSTAFCVGRGCNIWSSVHVEDLAKFYLFLITRASWITEGHDEAWSGKAYYFIESGAYSGSGLAIEIAKVLHDKQLLPTPEVKHVTMEDLVGLGVSMTEKSAAALGWWPTEKDITSLLTQEVDAYLDAGVKVVLPDVDVAL
ncbi:dTDP-4-oxo-6-deoxy-D-allose reductase [Madurella mycetomatis]|uniref:dTDP-4-oxo-6-deoxy-D-allose reductase n=1 Tax=Madurella mycetomatis TaxID=100816 RepID=A0A175VSW9_9PEZI|nr:dTDP-4-oxo-6-deoxy-D-allose reductase [Madurella mycetomatis]